MPKNMPIPDNMPAAVEMYESGANCVKVAVFLDVAPGTALSLLRRSGVKIRRRGFAAGSVVPQASDDDTDDVPLRRPPVTPEYLSILRQRWAEKIPHIVDIALQESGERHCHVR